MDEKDEVGSEAGGKSGLEKSVIGLLLLTAYGIALVLIVGGGMIHRKDTDDAPAPGLYEAPPEAMESAALLALEAFYEAPDLAAKAALVRDSERVMPMMRDYHGTRGHPFPTLGRVSPGQAAEFDGKPMVLFEVEPFSGPKYFVAMVWDGRRFAVDWESMTCYGTMDWMEFNDAQPAAPQTMRVFIREAKETLPPPGAGETAAFFQIEHRDDPQPLAAIAAAELAETLSALTAGRRTPVILELAWERPAPDRLPILSIRKLVAEGWSR
jgi:hypothetical protein